MGSQDRSHRQDGRERFGIVSGLLDRLSINYYFVCECAWVFIGVCVRCNFLSAFIIFLFVNPINLNLFSTLQELFN